MKFDQVILIDTFDLVEAINLQYNLNLNLTTLLGTLFFDYMNDTVRCVDLDVDLTTIDQDEFPLYYTIISYLQDIFPNKDEVYIKICW